MKCSERTKKGFKELCNSLSPATGIKRVWSLLKSFAGKRGANIQYTNNPESDEIKNIQEQLMGENMAPFDLPIIDDNDHPMNQPFLVEEIVYALAACKKNFSPGIDQVPYEVLRKLTPEYLYSVGEIFTECFMASKIW